MIVRRGGKVSRRRLKMALLVCAIAALTIMVLVVVGGVPSLSTPTKLAANTPDVAGCDQVAIASRTDLTMSFDAEPAYCEWGSIQPGSRCANGVLDGSSTGESPSAAFVRDDSPGNVRHGKYSARVVLNPGDQASYTCKAESVDAIKGIDEGESSESWWGWSWKLPLGWRGTDSWGTLFQFTVDHVLWPSYGMLSFDAATTNSLRLGIHTGLTPNPGSSSYDSAYQKWVTLLGPGTPRPMVYGKWLDFYMHVVWQSRTSGVLEIWYRVDGEQRFTKLYSDVPGGGALIQVAPHPTLLYNTANGAPGEDGKPGLALIGGFYRANTPWTNEYWWDGMRRRESEAAILAGFPNAPAAPVPPAPPPPPPPPPVAPPAGPPSALLAASPATPTRPSSPRQAVKTCGPSRPKDQPGHGNRRRRLRLHGSCSAPHKPVRRRP